MTDKSRRAFLTLGSVAVAAGFAGVSRAQTGAAVAASQPPSIDVLAGAPAIEDIALSPSGAQVAFITEKDDDKSLIVFTVADNALKRMIIGKGKVRGLLWADEDHVVVSYSQTTSLRGKLKGNHEVSLASVINIRTGSVTNLFSGMSDFYNTVAGGIYRIKIGNDAFVAAASYRTDPGADQPLCLYRFAPGKSVGQPLCEMPGNVETFVLTSEGRVAAYSTFDEVSKLWSLYYNVGKSPGNSVFKSVFDIKEPIDTPSLKGLGRDGASVVVQMADAARSGKHYQIAADGVLNGPLDDSGAVSSAALFHPTTWRLAGFARDNDWFTYDYDDPVLKKLAASVAVAIGDDERYAIADFADDPRKMILYAEGEGNAGTYYYADFSVGDAHQIATRYVGLPAEWVSQKQPIAYQAADGLTIHGYVTVPPNRTGAKNLPLVVLPHGGPEARDHIDFDWQVQCLASRGYAVLQPNFRGSTGYGRAFVDAAHGEFGRKMQSDLSDGVGYLATQGLIDPKRTAIMGASYGGYAALAGATLGTGYTCAVAIAAVSDPDSFVDYVADRQADDRWSSAVLYWRQLMGEPKSYRDISPLHQAAHAGCPILLIHGSDDTVVPVDQSVRMNKALKDNGKDVELVTFKGQDHWETNYSARVEMMKVALAFLQKHNPA